MGNVAAKSSVHDSEVIATTFSNSLPRGAWCRWTALAFLTVVNSATIISMRRSRINRPGKDMYLSTTAVVLAEFVKLFTCASVLMYEKGGVKPAMLEISQNLCNFQMVLPLIVPGLLYAIQNNLLYLSLTNLSGAVHVVSYQLKILTTALFSVLMLGKKLNCSKWFSLLALTVGVMLIQAPRRWSCGMRMTGKSWIGFSAILGSCLTSGFAGVFLEKLMKESDGSLWIKNIQLAIVVGVLGFMTCLRTDWTKIRSKGFFQGYDRLAWFVVIWNALSGIIVSVVLKYADNISKCFASALSIVLTCLISFLSGEFLPDLQFVIGTFLVIASSLTYSGSMKHFRHQIQKARAWYNHEAYQ